MYKQTLLVVAILIASLALSLLSVAPILADSGSNDDFASAEFIEPGPMSGSMGPGDDEDYYKFNITAGDVISISFKEDGATVYLYDGNENELIEEVSVYFSTHYITYVTSAETTYSVCYLIFETTSPGSMVTYDVLTFTLTPQNDAGSGKDAPKDPSAGLTIGEGSINGEVNEGTDNQSVGGEDGMDCYKFWAGQGDRINISFSTTSPDHIYMNLLEPDEDYIFQDLAVKIGMTAYGEWWTANETAMGYFFIEIYQDMVPGYYTLALDIIRQNDANSGEDAKADHQYSSIVSNGDINGHLADEDSTDSYKLQAGNGDVISVNFRSYSIGDFIYIDLLGSDGSVLVSNKSSSTDYGSQFMYYTANETALQDFFLKVWMDTAPGNYVATLQVQKQNDAASWVDAPGTSATNLVIGPGGFEGWIFDLDTVDMYKIPLVSGDVLDITLGVSYGSYVSMVLMNKTMYTLATRSTFFGSLVKIRYCIDTIVDNTTTYLKVFGGSARYSLGITIGGQNDAGKGGDAGGVAVMGSPPTDPYSVSPGTFSGYMHQGDTSDGYSLDVQSNKRLNITVIPEETLMVGVFLYNGTDQPVSSKVGSLGQKVVLVHDLEEGEKMGFILESYGYFGNYTVTVTITDITPAEGTPSSPVLFAVPGPGKVTLTWSAPPSDGGSPITGYKVYRKISGSLIPATLLTTVGPSVLTYVDSFVVFGSTYEYYVRATNINGEGNASNSVTGSPTQATSDTDSDGMPDAWEDQYGLGKNDPSDASKDKDNDGVTNIDEYIAGTDPTDDDSKPLPTDTDGDGIPDWWEVRYELNPGDSADALLDPDSDGRSNLKEYQDGTNPRVKDSPIADDDDDDDEDDDGFLNWVPLGWVGCCIGIIVLGVLLLIIVLIVVFIVAKGRKKKDEKEEEDVPIAAGGDEEASEE